MKKLLSTMLCVGLLSINLACLAETANQVKLTCTNIPLKSTLQNKYSAYRIEYFNEGQTPIMVNNVKCYNRVAIADAYGGSYGKSPFRTLLLSFVTLGLSTIPTNMAVLDAQNEARRYNALDYTGASGSNVSTVNEVLPQGQSVQFNLLVPLNETPEVVGTFEELVSHKYIRVQNK